MAAKVVMSPLGLAVKMNIFQEIKLLFKLKGLVNQMNQNHNWGSTEFWMSVIPVVTTAWGQIRGSNIIPQPYATYVEIGVPVAYGIGRQIYKAFRDFKSAQALAVVEVKPA